MAEHFQRNYDTFDEIFLDKVIKGGSLSKEIGRLKETAKIYIDRATVAKEATIALNLCKARQLIPYDSTKNRETVGVLQHAEQQLYDFVHDDLFIVAAFENYAKAVLLSKRYVVHSIRSPESLRKEQNNKPIHINTIRAKRNLPKVRFEHYTVGVNQLLKPNYIQFLSISDKAEFAICQCQGIRNKIHFGGPNLVGFGPGLYEGLIDLKDTICS